MLLAVYQEVYLPVEEGNILTVLEEGVGYHSNLGIHLKK